MLHFVLTICWVLFFDRMINFFLYRSDDIGYMITLIITMIVLLMAGKPDTSQEEDKQ